MLAFDIETTGLSDSDTVTAACVYDPARSIKETFLFSRGYDSPRTSSDPARFLQLLDDADVLCAFNGARFDIPFIQRQWKVFSYISDTNIMDC